MAQPRKSFTTPRGTELPLLSLKGKEYLQVAHRLVWFREVFPDGVLKTTMIALSGEGLNEYAVFKTEVYIPSGNGSQMIASAHKKETRGGFDDFIEKAETGSIGRALALAGFGTQFTADELDEKERLADAPIEVISKGATTSTTVTSVTPLSNGSAPTPRSSFRRNVTPVAKNNDDGI
jgi:hypothetical protein